MGSKQVQIATEYAKGIFKEDSGLLIKPGMSPDCINVTEDQNLLRRPYGVSAFGETLTGIPQFLYQYNKSDGSHEFLVLTTDGMYKLAFPAWAAITGAWAGNVNDLVHYAQLADTFIITDGSQAIKKYEGGNLESITGLSDVLARVVRTFAAHVILLDTTELGSRTPSRFRWSAIGDPETYSGVGAGYLDLIDTPDEIINGFSLGDKFLVYKDNSIWRITHLDAPTYFFAEPWITDVGLYASRTLVPLANSHIFLGYDNVYLVTSQGYKAIGDPIKSLLFGRDRILSGTFALNSWAFFNYIENEYWLLIPTTSDYPKTALCYSLTKDRWFLRTFTSKMNAAGVYRYPSSFTWAGFGSSTWADLEATPPWSDPAWNELSEADTGDKILFVDVLGDSWLYDQTTSQIQGEYALAYWTSQDLVTVETTRYSSYQIECQGGGTIQLSYSLDKGITWTNLDIKVVPQTWDTLDWHLNFTGRVVRFKLTLGSVDATQVRRQSAYIIARKR